MLHSTLYTTRSLICAALIFGSPLVGATVTAHPFHISSAEMEFNSQSGRFEVSLKLHAVDLEQALTKYAKHAVDVENDPQAKRLLTEYLSQHFVLMPKSQLKVNEAESARPTSIPKTGKVGKSGSKSGASRPPATQLEGASDRSKVHFVGMELKTSWVWLYFELEPPAKRPDLVFVNSVLLDLTKGQINTVSVRTAKKKFALKTIAKQPWVAFSEDWLESPKR